MRGQDPRVLLQLVSAWPRQIVVESLVDGVPDLDPTDFLLEIVVVVLSAAGSRVFDLGCDRGDREAALNRPLDGITLTFGELELFDWL